jgi:hypothetical protein
MAEKDKKKDEKKKSQLPPPNMYGSELERARDIQAGTALDTADFDTRFKNASPGKRKTMMAKGGKVSSCSKRADGIAKKGKTQCKMV